MKISALTELFSVRDLRNGALGVIVVLGGIGLSLVTLYAHRTGDIRLAGISAGLSLVFVLLILIFVVPPLARNAGREASQMNLPFEFTTGGAIILVLIMIVGFSAWNTGNNLLFIVLSFLLATMLVGFVAGHICLKKLDVKMRFPETIFAGEATPILVSLHNRKRIFPAFSVVAKVRGKERERSIADDDLKAILPRWIAERLGRASIVRRTLNHFVHVGPRQTLESKAEHTFPNRGRLIIKDFELSTKFPFGFFNHRRRLPARETELIVFPRLMSFTDFLDDTPLDVGQFAAHKRGAGQDLLALRDYRPNDDLRNIDWKATARVQTLTVREFAAEDEKRVTIVLDNRLPKNEKKMPTLREKLEAEQSGKGVIVSEQFERGVSLSAAIISRFADENASIRLVIGDFVGEFGVGRKHLYDCLRRLAVAEPAFINNSSVAPDSKLRSIFDEQNNSHFYVVTVNRAKAFPVEAKVIKF
ncbi:MAG: DUF58 domain-containing protein [Pyrinomonadaceae bacterium]